MGGAPSLKTASPIVGDFAAIPPGGSPGGIGRWPVLPNTILGADQPEMRRPSLDNSQRGAVATKIGGTPKSEGRACESLRFPFSGATLQSWKLGTRGLDPPRFCAGKPHFRLPWLTSHEISSRGSRNVSFCGTAAAAPTKRNLKVATTGCECPIVKGPCIHKSAIAALVAQSCTLP